MLFQLLRKNKTLEEKFFASSKRVASFLNTLPLFSVSVLDLNIFNKHQKFCSTIVNKHKDIAVNEFYG
ncbi:MAG: hypothetical protein D6780_02745 [Candidatus Dadabacteria bacterium]|nr:MAG: hypothetical protein D6780_02745 [Candidatus Dadabacteria bacterium]